MARLEGRVAFVTGAARGQGRSHAVRLAQEGADIIAVDISAQIETVPFPMGTPDDLAATVEEVEALGRRIIASAVDVRDYDALKATLDDGVARLGRLDIVAANAGIVSFGRAEELTEQAWRDMIDVNLTGVWHTVKAAVPQMIEQNSGGAITFIGSTEALKGAENISSYAASKHGVTGLMTSLARELGEYGIRVNSVNPTCVDTDMINNPFVYKLFRPDLEQPTREDVVDSFAGTLILPVPWIEPSDVSKAILYLASESGRYITASTMVIGAGFIVKS